MNFPENNSFPKRHQHKKDREPIEIELHIMKIVASNYDGITFNQLMIRSGLSSKLLHKYLDKLSDVIHKDDHGYKGWKGRPGKYVLYPMQGIFERIKKYEEIKAIRG